MIKDIPLFEKETIKKLEHSKIEIMRNWAAVNGKTVRQRSNRQQTAMAAAGTITNVNVRDRENRKYKPGEGSLFPSGFTNILAAFLYLIFCQIK